MDVYEYRTYRSPRHFVEWKKEQVVEELGESDATEAIAKRGELEGSHSGESEVREVLTGKEVLRTKRGRMNREDLSSANL